MILIKLCDLSLHFGQRTALQNVSLEINQGEIVTLIGPNGAGKSSLVRLIVGAIKPDQGHIEKMAGLRIGYVPQKLHIDAFLPLDVRRFLKLQKLQQPEDLQIAIEKTQISKLLSRPMAHLSGGELKRVMLAYALISKPHVLILDEPTAGLDQPSTIAFYELIERLRHEYQMAILMVSHDLNVVMSASDRVICLNKHICCQGTPSAVSQSPEYVALFGVKSAPVAIYSHHHNHDLCDHLGHDHV